MTEDSELSICQTKDSVYSSHSLHQSNMTNEGPVLRIEKVNTYIM